MMHKASPDHQKDRDPELAAQTVNERLRSREEQEQEEEEQDAGCEGEEDDKDIKTTPLDGGWGWMCVLGCAIIHVVVGTTIRAFGMLYLALIERYRASATATAWTGAINFACLGFFGPVASMLCKKYGCRSVTIFAGLLTSSGIIATGYAPNIYVTYITFGVITGFGLCLSYTSGFIILGVYFDKRKALAMSIGTFSSGLSVLVCPPVMIHVFRHSGFQGMFLLVAGISLHLCVAGALFRPLEDNHKKTKSKKKSAVEGKQPKQNGVYTNGHNGLKPITNGISVITDKDNLSVAQCDSPLLSVCEREGLNGATTNGGVVTTQNGHKVANGVIAVSTNGHVTGVSDKCHADNSEKKLNMKEMLKVNAKLFKTVPFFTMIFLFFSFNLGTSSSAFDVILAIERGVEETRAAILISIAGVTGVITTIGGGFILDMERVKPHRLHIYNALNFLFGMSSFGTASSSNYAGFVVSAFLRGASSGLVAAQRATIIGDIVGREKTMEGLGLLLMFGAFGTLFGRSLAGPIRDAHGEYSGIFYLSGSLSIISSLLFCVGISRLNKTAKASSSQLQHTSNSVNS